MLFRSETGSACALAGENFVSFLILVRHCACGCKASLSRPLKKNVLSSSFALQLSRPEDFEGGGTYIQALGETIQIQQGQALFWHSQLFHGAAPVTRGERYAISAFTTFSSFHLALRHNPPWPTLPLLHPTQRTTSCALDVPVRGYSVPDHKNDSIG